jgi:hypothetical protein
LSNAFSNGGVHGAAISHPATGDGRTDGDSRDRSFAYTGQELASKAKVKIDDARAIALKVRPGAISTEELEKEKGGSGLRYSFGVKSGKALYEVGVDAADRKGSRERQRGQATGLAGFIQAALNPQKSSVRRPPRPASFCRTSVADS